MRVMRGGDFLTKGLLKEEISSLIIEGQKSKGKTCSERTTSPKTSRGKEVIVL